MKIQELSPNSKKGFKLLAGINREIKVAHVNKMMESIKVFEESLRPVLVAFVTFMPGINTLWVIDGQHLWEACRKLDIATPYLVLKNKINTIEELVEKIALLNHTSKSWTFDDYVNIWAHFKPEYKTLMDFSNKYTIEKGILAQVLNHKILNMSAKVGGLESISKKIKTGHFKIKDQEFSTTSLDYMQDLKQFHPLLGRAGQKLMLYYITSNMESDKYNHQSYKSTLIKHKQEIVSCNGELSELIPFILPEKI